METAVKVTVESSLDEEAGESEAYQKLQLMIVQGDRNAREALYRLDATRRRQASAAGARQAHLPSYSDILLRIEVRELAELARMGISLAVSTVGKIRALKSTASEREIKQTVSQLHDLIFQQLSQSLSKPAAGEKLSS